MNSIAIILGAYLALNAVVVILWVLVNRDRTRPGKERTEELLRKGWEQVERDSEI